MLSAAPISPEERCRTNSERMQQHADLARLFGRAAIPLTLLAQLRQGRQLRMLAPYTTRRLPSASLRCSCGVSCWSAGHRSVPSGWSAKSWPAKRPAFHAEPYFWRGIARGRSGVWWRGWESRSKLGRADWVRMKLMPQFESQVPDPLGDQLPALLSPGRMAAPAVGIHAPDLHRRVPAQKRHDAGTTRPHRRP